MIKFLSLMLAGTVIAGAVEASPAHFKGQELSGRAKVSIESARAIALKARPGRVTDQELEKESGGSGLRYSFDIRSQGKTFEVGVDAVTGRVLENGSETLAKEARELVEEHPKQKPH